MGESIVDAPKVENKMGKSPLDVGALDVSVSFGRFENDSLCWEKWSAFPANKHLEEVEKCSTPGSVAQKKAYFEAHYKKIAARKAEQVDQEKKKGNNLVDLEDQIKTDSVNNNCVEEIDGVKSDGPSLLNGVELESMADNVKIGMNGCVTENTANKIDLETKLINLRAEVTDVSGAFIAEPNNEVDTTSESEDLLPPAVDAKDVFSSSTGDFQLGKVEETVHIKEYAPSLALKEAEEQPEDKANGQRYSNGQRVVLEGPRKSDNKITTLKKATNLQSTKKKQSSPAVKSPAVSTPKPLKPALSRPATSTTRPPAEKQNGFTPLTGKRTAPAASKRVASPSSHMPLSWGPADSDPSSLATTRKSLIMERMGDKDIIKRAFRTFQNKHGQVSSSSLAISSPTYQLHGKETERKTWASTTPQDSNEGANDSVKKMLSLHRQQGTRRMSTPTGSLLKSMGSERSSTTASSSFGSKSHDRADKRKGFSKKSGDEVSAKEAERTLLQSKMKVQKDAEFKKLQQSFNFKAKQLPAFYRGSGIAKSSTYKKGAKTEASG